MKHIHIIGAGLAGLAAALSCVRAGARVSVYEAGPAAGGRCRSYFDRGLGLRVDNGNHMLLSGNGAAMDYLDQVGARDTLTGPGDAFFPFLDLATGERWSVAPSVGRVPWWVFRPSRRVPGTRLRDYLALRGLRRPAVGDTVESLLSGSGPLYRRLMEPLAIAALNTLPAEGSARLMAAVVAGSLMQGGAACIPSFPRMGLSESFVDPAIAMLRAHNATVQLGRRVGAMRVEDGRVVGLDFPDGPVEIARGAAVVMAVPAWVATDLLPGLSAPDAFEAILNLHYRVDVVRAGAWGRAGFLGLVGGMAEWIFLKPGVVSITVSAANRFAELSNDDLSARIWPEVRRALDLPEPMPPVRVVREKRATFAASAAQDARRPPARTRLDNLALAGDWTATGLPATIEGAIRSGRAAADIVLAAA